MLKEVDQITKQMNEIATSLNIDVGQLLSVFNQLKNLETVYKVILKENNLENVF